MHDRGCLQKDHIADINIIDFNALRLFRPEAVFDLPAGGRRLVQRAEGCEMTIKSGEIVSLKAHTLGPFPVG